MGYILLGVHAGTIFTHSTQINSSFVQSNVFFSGIVTCIRGFKCLDVTGGRVYISREVVFDETIYPFSKLNPNAGICLRSEILLLPDHSPPHNGVELVDESNSNAHIFPVSTNSPLFQVTTAKQFS